MRLGSAQSLMVQGWGAGLVLSLLRDVGVSSAASSENETPKHSGGLASMSRFRLAAALSLPTEATRTTARTQDCASSQDTWKVARSQRSAGKNPAFFCYFNQSGCGRFRETLWQTLGGRSEPADRGLR